MFKAILGILLAPLGLLKDGISKFITNNVIKSGIKYLITALGALLAAPHVGDTLGQLGIQLDQKQLELGLGAVAFSLRNYLKHKFSFLSWL